MALSSAGLGLLIGSPIAGAILDGQFTAERQEILGSADIFGMSTFHRRSRTGCCQNHESWNYVAEGMNDINGFGVLVSQFLDSSEKAQILYCIPEERIFKSHH